RVGRPRLHRSEVGRLASPGGGIQAVSSSHSESSAATSDGGGAAGEPTITSICSTSARRRICVSTPDRGGRVRERLTSGGQPLRGTRTPPAPPAPPGSLGPCGRVSERLSPRAAGRGGAPDPPPPRPLRQDLSDPAGSRVYLIGGVLRVVIVGPHEPGGRGVQAAGRVPAGGRGR